MVYLLILISLFINYNIGFRNIVIRKNNKNNNKNKQNTSHTHTHTQSNRLTNLPTRKVHGLSDLNTRAYNILRERL